MIEVGSEGALAKLRSSLEFLSLALTVLSNLTDAISEVFNREIYEQQKATLGNDITAIERVMNHQHIDDILLGTDKVGTDNLFYLGQALKQMWESRLKSLYADRRFEVCCNRDDYTVVVMFYQLRTNS